MWEALEIISSLHKIRDLVWRIEPSIKMHNLGPVYLITKTCSLLIKIPTILEEILVKRGTKRLVKPTNRTVIISLLLNLRARHMRALITTINRIKTLHQIKGPTNRDIKAILTSVLRNITSIVAVLA